ncbi:hypothetical protein CTI12_AA328320 [Artemisia annua]|uniref:Amine oxidase domain-containing protein n=1 Tax=Artemisia annua TaxID=35608 RepID=A0A2U1MYB1_ARTAN|nr:hypothetical protein CTI12_AA328320 [Artemisia annua]
MSKTRVGVVGSGIGGLMSAYVLTKAGADVVLYDTENSHAKTFTVDGVDLDLGLMAFNRVTSPNIVKFMETLGLDMDISDMSFSVSLDEGNGYEWGSRNGLSSLFAQKGNLINLCFLKMFKELTNFKDDVLRYLEEDDHNENIGRKETLGNFIKKHSYSELFQMSYLVPICSSFWSCPAEGVMRLSAFSVLSYFRNHHLFQLLRRPQWFTVKNGAHTYIRKIKEELESVGCHIRTCCAVQSVLNDEDGCLVSCEDGSQEKYSGCILDTDAPDTLRILGEQATYEEKRIFGAFNYVYNDIFLHHDRNLMPRNQTAWSALNFVGTNDNKLCLTYWLNVMQNIKDSEPPFLVTINPSRTPKSTLLKWSTGRAIPSVAASKALVELHNIQGKRGIWFCGSYQGYGFHEDEMKAGMVAANGILNKSSDILNNPKQMVPTLMEAGARLFLVRFLQDHIATGTLILLEDGGTMFTFEGTRKKNPLRVCVRVHSPQFYLKIVTKADLGLGEAYVNGDFSLTDNTEGLFNLIMILIVNNDLKDHNQKSSKRYFSLRRLVDTIVFNSYTSIWKSNEVFSLFLDETMTYSCALFKSEDEDLKVAQMRKISSLIEKARVDKNHEVLDIGCGWGAFAIEIVKQTGCKYTGITLSKEQIVYAENEVKKAGLQGRIRFLLCDYRQLPNTFKYDRIISCEAIEHVGHEYYEEFFRCCESVLTEDGIFVLQFISVPDGMYDEYRRSAGFVREYIFPGGCLPSLSRLTSAMATSSRLCVEHVEKIGTHYDKTLRCWRANLLRNRSKILALGFDQEFIRTFEYYFDSTAAGFKTETLGDYQVVFSRPGNVATIEDPYKGTVVRAS